jgi:ureidoacrylate peracid hydrolase
VSALIGENCVLLVVDMQNGFCHPGGSFAAMGFDVAALRPAVGGCRVLIDAAHRAGVPVIFTRFAYQAGYADAGVTNRELFPRIREHRGLEAGSWDAELLADMPVSDGDLIIEKSRYSSFYGTRLEPLLRGQGVRSLVVCGVTTNMCVETTVRDASQRDYRTFVVGDATAEFSPERHQHALDSIRYGFGWVVDRAALTGEWSARSAASARPQEPATEE